MNNDKKLDYLLLHSNHSYGRYGQFKLKIEVEATKMPEINKEIRISVYKAVDLINDSIHAAIIEKDPKTKDGILENKKLVDLFDNNIFVEEIPNGYCNNYCCRHLPWFKVTTKIGHFTIGWRRSVIQIDWSETVGTKKSEELFSNENVTKGDKYIHAWSFEDAKRYINTIIENIS